MLLSQIVSTSVALRDVNCRRHVRLTGPKFLFQPSPAFAVFIFFYKPGRNAPSCTDTPFSSVVGVIDYGFALGLRLRAAGLKGANSVNLFVCRLPPHPPTFSPKMAREYPGLKASVQGLFSPLFGELVDYHRVPAFGASRRNTFLRMMLFFFS